MLCRHFCRLRCRWWTRFGHFRHQRRYATRRKSRLFSSSHQIIQVISFVLRLHRGRVESCGGGHCAWWGRSIWLIYPIFHEQNLCGIALDLGFFCLCDCFYESSQRQSRNSIIGDEYRWPTTIPYVLEDDLGGGAFHFFYALKFSNMYLCQFYLFEHVL